MAAAAGKTASLAAPMSALDARDAVRRVQMEIGEQSQIFVSLSTEIRGAPLTASVYAHGMMSRDGLTFRVHGDTFEQLIAAVQARWIEHRDDHVRRTIEAMALEIIRLTDALGECTDAALRGARFSASDVMRFGEAACQRAAEMASKGPFEIVSGGLANEVAA